MKRKAKVHLLPTEKASIIYKKISLNTLFLGTYNTSNEDNKRLNQHIYITADEGIKDGDYIISHLISGGYVLGKVIEIINDKVFYETNNGGVTKQLANIKNCSKIIASTDESLDLPKLIIKFSLDYMVSHNKGNPIVDVLVEYEQVCARCNSNDLNECWSAKECSDGQYDSFNIKLNENQYISLSNPKDSWSRDEVKQHLIYCMSEIAAKLGHAKTSEEMKVWNDETTEYIKNNL